MTEKVAIVGLGLIGASLGLNFCHAKSPLKVSGFDIDPDTRQQALELGCVNEIGILQDVVAGAGFVFICTPISTVPGIVEQVAAICSPECIITDVGSTKSQIVKVFEDLPPGVVGIGGHPMAGSEQQGIAGADRYLFENAVYVLTPGKNCPQSALDRLSALIRETGAHIIIMDADNHDRVVAGVSHLPHLVASALVSMLETEEETLNLAAGGFRDTTRIASGDPKLWADILISNRHQLVEHLDRFIDRLADLKNRLEDADRSGLEEHLTQARNTRETLPRRRKGLVPYVHEVICLVPDQPGIIGSLGTWLGEQGINIADIEILRVREGDGGTIRLGVSAEEDGPRAVETLRSRGVKAWLR